MNCPKCGKSVPPNAAFCRYCGIRMGVQPVPAGKICPTCGTMLAAQAKFCSKCGTRMDEQPKPLICASCGAQLPSGSLFCNKCGGRVDQTSKAYVCSGCGAQLAPDFLFCNLCGTPSAKLSAAEQKAEKAEPVPPSTPEPLPNAEPVTILEPQNVSANAFSSTEPVLVLSSDTVIEPEEKPIIENEPESVVVTTPEPVPETIAVSGELADAEASAKQITADNCPTCGKERIPGMAFCINCGARLPQAEPAAVPAPEPAPGIESEPEPDITATPMQELALEKVPVPVPLPAADTCPTCGKERIPGMAFCTGCGARLITPQTEPVAVSAPEPVPDIEPKPEPDITATLMQELAFEEMPAPAATVNNCPTCGKECMPGLAFCINCGTRMTPPPTEPAVVCTPEPVAEIEPTPEPDIAATPIQELAFEEVPAPMGLPEPRVCPTCGYKCIPGMAFCTGCGKRLTPQEPALAPETAPVIRAYTAPVVKTVAESPISSAIERIQMLEPEPKQPAPAWQSVCAACGMVVASGLSDCPRCGAKV